MEAKIVDPMKKRSVVKDKPDERKWEQLKREEVKRLIKNSNCRRVTEYE